MLSSPLAKRGEGKGGNVYRLLWLEYDNGEEWIQISPASNRPHYYDELVKAAGKLLDAARFAQSDYYALRIVREVCQVIDEWVVTT